MIAEFKASHFAFLTDADQGYYLMDALAKNEKAEKMPEFGAWFVKGPNGYTVSMVLNDTSAAKAGLRPGDVVTSIDGKPFEPVASLKDLVGKTVPISYLRAGVTHSASVAVSSEQALDLFLDATRSSANVVERSGRKIGYFHLWTQAGEQFKTALSNAIYSKFKETDAMILDLRDGFGGRPEGYADPFFRPDIWLEWGNITSHPLRELFGYGRPLVVLINGGSRSAKEVLSDIFKISHRATLVGQTTAGNVLGTFPRRINGWSYLEVPMVDVVVDGTRLEGRGVSPDVTVSVEYGPDGTDNDFETALQRLANSPKYHPQGRVR
jgi:carboxyl-terminal processing protease